MVHGSLSEGRGEGGPEASDVSGKSYHREMGARHSGQVDLSDDLRVETQVLQYR